MAEKRRKKRNPAWVAYYCKVRGFEAHGNGKGAGLTIQLELLEPVPKVESLKLSVHGEEREWGIKEEWIPEEGWERKLVSSTAEPGSYAARLPDGAVEVITWWDRGGVTALLNVLLSDRQVYISFDAQEFYRNHAKVRGIEWFTEGAWRSNVVGEDSDLY